MRYAILCVLLGCSSGPSVVVTDPPPIVVEEPGPLTIIRQRKPEPVEAPKPKPPLIAELPDHEGDPIVAELPPIPIRPDSWLIWARGVKDGLEVADHVGDANKMVADASRQGFLDTCPCGPVCNCGPGCPCPDCPHRKADSENLYQPGGDAKPPLLPARELVAIGAEWCGPCLTIHKAAEGIEGVRFLDVDRDTAEVGRLWGNERSRFVFMGPHKAPASLPAFVLTIDGQPVKVWYASGTDRQPWTAERIRFLRDFQVPTETGGSQPTHDAQPNDSAKAGDSPALDGSPAWCVRIHIDMPNGSAVGSGVVVASRGGRSYVLTNHHVASVGGTIRVKVGGDWRPATRVRYDQRSDLYLLSIAGDAEPLPVAASVSPDTPVESHGFASGVVYRAQPTTLRYDALNRSYSTDARYCGGESGGPVVANGELVGLIYGADVESNPDGGSGLVVGLPSIRNLLAQGGVL